MSAYGAFTSQALCKVGFRTAGRGCLGFQQVTLKPNTYPDLANQQTKAMRILRSQVALDLGHAAHEILHREGRLFGEHILSAPESPSKPCITFLWSLNLSLRKASTLASWDCGEGKTPL